MLEVRGRHPGQRGQGDEAAKARAEQEPVSIAEDHDEQEVSKGRTRGPLRRPLRNWRMRTRGAAVSAPNWEFYQG